ncbi:MAG: hypothetical protein ACKOX6_18335 [Bdellovibrio sp.]
MTKNKSKQTFDFEDEGDSAPSSFGFIARNNREREALPEKLEPIMSQSEPLDSIKYQMATDPVLNARSVENLSQTRAIHEPKVRSDLTESELFDLMAGALSKLPPIPNLSQSEANHEPNLSQQILENQKRLEATLPVQKKLEPIMGQTEANHEPNLSQTRVNHEPEPRSNLSQSEAKRKPIMSQTRAKPEPELEPLHEPIMGQTRAKHEPKSRNLRNIESLIGLQRNALNYIFQSCLSNGSRISSSLAVENMALSLNTTAAAVRKAVQRLEHDKRFIERYDWKDGRGGWTKYEIFEDIYAQLVFQTRAIHEPNLSQTRVKVEPELEPQLRPNAPYSSSISLNINTNTIALPENLKPFGISAPNLQKLIESGKNSHDVVQRSLDALSFDVGKGKKGNLANILFGILNSGREYVSQKHAEHLNNELLAEFKRIDEAENAKRQLEELLMKRKWEDYKSQNPTWNAVYRAKYGPKMSEETLEQFAYGDFLKRAGESL